MLRNERFGLHFITDLFTTTLVEKKTWKIFLNLLVYFDWFLYVWLKLQIFAIKIYIRPRRSSWKNLSRDSNMVGSPWNCIPCFDIWGWRLIKIGFGRTTSWLVFLNFYISYHKHSFQPIVEARNKIQIFISMVSTLHPLIIIYSDEPIHRVLLLHDSNRYKDLLV